MVREAILGDEPLDMPGHRAYYAGQQRKRRAEGEAELKARYEEVLSKLRPEQRQKVQGQVDSKGMSWMSVVPRAKESFDLSAQQWRDRVHLQYGWDLQGLPEKCDGCGKRFSTDHVLVYLKGGLVGWGHNQFRDVIGKFSRKVWNNCTWKPVVGEALQRARDGGSDGLRADFVVRGVWEPDRDCLFDTRIIHAGSPGRACQHISYQNSLNTSTREKVRRYKAAAEERRATFCPSRQSGISLSQRSPTGCVSACSSRSSKRWICGPGAPGRGGGARGSRMARGLPLSSRDSGVCCI